MSELFKEDGSLDIDLLGENHKEAIAKYVNDNYRDFLPEDAATSAPMAPIKDLQSLAKSYLNAQELIGKKGIIKPQDNDPDDKWDNYFRELGRPDSVDGYEYDKVEGFDNEEFVKGFSEAAHTAGLTNKQAKTALRFIQDRYVNEVTKYNNDYKTKMEKDWADVQREFGDKFEINQKKVNALIAKFGDADLQAHIRSSGIGRDAKLFKFLSGLADNFNEDMIGDIDGSSNVYTPREAMSKANDIMTNKNNSLYEAYYSAEHPRHKEAMDEVLRLYKMADSKK
jgi:hypothetical protein